ncbi:MAG TPA: ABC transporter permease [bacterium]|nr:ABC transporter permease [bacterium]
MASRLWRERAARIAAAVLAVYVLAAVAAPLIAPFNPLTTSLLDRLQPPSRAHWLGQDEVGRDILSRIIFGARVSLAIGLLSVVFGLAAGGAMGVLSGVSRRADAILMRLVDIIMAFPFMLRAIAVVAILGPGFANLFIAIGLGRIPPFARLVRAHILTFKEETFVEAARAVGATDVRVVIRHILPQTTAPIVTYATLEMGTAILAAAALSFLGLGVNAPTPEWGAIASSGRQYLRAAPQLVVFPSLAIFFAVWSFNLLGDALRDAMDPKLRNR